MDELSERLSTALAERYHIIRELGSGGMAVVYLAEDLKHERRVALKVLRPELAASLGADRFLREIRIAANLAHPHILPVHDSGEADGLLFYVMPYVEGESLRDLMNRERQLDLDEARRLAREVADALGYAHQHGVVHRDIKPENILLHAGHAVVADFGIARALSAAGADHLTETGLAIGTPAYMSPEQGLAQPLDARSDIYSLGCVLYEMLGGDPPYTASTPQAIIARRAVDPIPRVRVVRETVPDDLEQIVTRTLAKAPADRYSSATDLAEALGRPTGSLPAITQPVAATPHLRKVVPATAVAVAALALGWAAWTLLRPGAGAAVDASRIFVARFDNQTGDTTLDDVGKIVADWVARDLEQIPDIEVIDPRAAVFAVSSPPSGGDPASVRPLAERLGAGTVVSGSYYRARDSLRFQMSVTETRTGRLLDALEPVGGSLEDPLDGIATAGNRVAASLASLFARDFAPIAGSLTHPKDYDAYREYIASLEYFSQADYPAAMRSAYRALALDSTFYAASILAAVMHFNMGQVQLVDSITADLNTHRRHLTRLERHVVDAWAAEVRGDRETAYNESRKAYELAPTVTELALMVGAWAQWSNRMRAAVDVLSAVDVEHGTAGYPQYWVWLGAPLHALGEYDRELEVARRAQHQFPNQHGARWMEMRVLAAMGRSEDVERVIDASSALTKTAGYSRGEYFTGAAREFAAHGYSVEATGMLERAIEWFRNLPPTEANTLATRSALALTLYDAEAWDEAAAVFVGLRHEQPDDRLEYLGKLGVTPELLDHLGYLGHLGVIAARRGNHAEASRIDAALAELEIPYLSGMNTLWRARIAAVLDQTDEATTLLRAALGAGLPFGLWLHTDPALESLKDYPPFHELVDPIPERLAAAR